MPWFAKLSEKRLITCFYCGFCGYVLFPKSCWRFIHSFSYPIFLWVGRGAAALGELEIPQGFQQSKIVLLAEDESCVFRKVRCNFLCLISFEFFTVIACATNFGHAHIILLHQNGKFWLKINSFIFRQVLHISTACAAYAAATYEELIGTLLQDHTSYNWTLRGC